MSATQETDAGQFVTRTTVEVRLSSVYRKLGINSRSQFAGALAKPVRKD